MTAARVGTVTPNPAIDVAYGVPARRADDVVRLLERAGGKGVDVAAVAASASRFP